VLRLVSRNGFLELLLADIAPGTHSVADYLDVELGHGAERGTEHITVRDGLICNGALVLMRSCRDKIYTSR
jgi:hypothetical protein